MPSHKVHKWTDRKILDREYPEVHSYKDRGVTELGKAHRQISHPIHNIIKALRKGDMVTVVRSLADPDLKKLLEEKDEGRKAASLLHDAVDLTCSADKRTKILLELLAILDK